MRRRKKSRAFSRRGLTFIEMMIVTSLVAVIGLAVYQSLANGLKIWDRGQRFVTEENVALFLDQIKHDLHNAFVYSGFPLEGNSQRIAVPTIVKTLQDIQLSGGQTVYVDQMGRVEYSFDEVRGELYRRQANYSQALQRNFAPKRLLAEAVNSLNFFYYYKNDEDTERRKAILEDRLPFAVEIEVEFMEASGKKRKITRWVNIPAGL